MERYSNNSIGRLLKYLREYTPSLYDNIIFCGAGKSPRRYWRLTLGQSGPVIAYKATVDEYGVPVFEWSKEKNEFKTHIKYVKENEEILKNRILESEYYYLEQKLLDNKKDLIFLEMIEKRGTHFLEINTYDFCHSHPHFNRLKDLGLISIKTNKPDGKCFDFAKNDIEYFVYKYEFNIKPEGRGILRWLGIIQ